MARGDVLLVNLPTSEKREQSGRRPAVAVQTDIDKTRIIRKLGQLSVTDMTRIDTEIWQMLKPAPSKKE